MLFKTYSALESEDEPFDLFKRRRLFKKDPNSPGTTKPASTSLPETLVDRSNLNCTMDPQASEVKPTKPSKYLSVMCGLSPHNGQYLTTKAPLTTPNALSCELEFLSGSSIRTPDRRDTKTSVEQSRSKQCDKRLPQQKSKRVWWRNDFTKGSCRRETKRPKKAPKLEHSQADNPPPPARPVHDAQCRLLERLAQHPAQQIKRTERNRFSAFDEHNFSTLAPQEPRQDQKPRQIMPISALMLSSQDYYQFSRLPPIALDREERYNWGHIKARVKPCGLVSRRKRAALDLSSQAPDPMVDLLKRTERIRNQFNLSDHVSTKSTHRARLKNFKRVVCSPKFGHSMPPTRRRKQRELALESTGLSPLSRTGRKSTTRQYIQEFHNTKEVLAPPTSSLAGLDLANATHVEHCRFKNTHVTKETQVPSSLEAVETEERSITLPSLVHAITANDVSQSSEIHVQDAVRDPESPFEFHALPTDSEGSKAQASIRALDVNTSNGALPSVSSRPLGPTECPVQGRKMGNQFNSKADRASHGSLNTNSMTRKRSVFGTLLDELGDGSWARRVTFKDTTQVRFIPADEVDGAEELKEPTPEECKTVLAEEPILSLDTDGVHIFPLSKTQDVRISLHTSNEAGRRSLSPGPHVQSSASAYPPVSVFNRPEFEYKSFNTAPSEMNEQDQKGLSISTDRLDSRSQAASEVAVTIGVQLNNILAPPTPSPVQLTKICRSPESEWSSSCMNLNIEEKNDEKIWNHDGNASQFPQDVQGEEETYHMHFRVPSDDIISGHRGTSCSITPSNHSKSHQSHQDHFELLSNKRRQIGSPLSSLGGASAVAPPAAQLTSGTSGSFGNSESQSSCLQSKIEQAHAPRQVRNPSHRDRQHDKEIIRILVSCETHRPRRRKLDQLPSFFATRT